jgi:hypothetical protein
MGKAICLKDHVDEELMKKMEQDEIIKKKLEYIESLKEIVHEMHHMIDHQR